MKKNIKRIVTTSLLLLAVTSAYALTRQECESLNAGHCSCDINDNCRIIYVIK